jgi:hypothetical protein
MSATTLRSRVPCMAVRSEADNEGITVRSPPVRHNVSNRANAPQVDIDRLQLCEPGAPNIAGVDIIRKYLIGCLERDRSAASAVAGQSQHR